MGSHLGLSSHGVMKRVAGEDMDVMEHAREQSWFLGVKRDAQMAKIQETRHCGAILVESTQVARGLPRERI